LWGLGKGLRKGKGFKEGGKGDVKCKYLYIPTHADLPLLGLGVIALCGIDKLR
jgi:hypothetical protein